MFERLVISIIDRNEIAREGLKRIFADRGFGLVETMSDAYDLTVRPAHLVVITCADHSESIEFCTIAHSRYPEARIVLVVDGCCSDVVVDALDAGADGVLSRSISIEPMIASLGLIAMGEKVIPTCIVEDLPSRSRMPRSMASDCSDLSVRELAVLDRIAAGRANKLISRDLGIAEGTVKVHVKSILRKLGLVNRTQAALWAAGRPDLPVAPTLALHAHRMAR